MAALGLAIPITFVLALGQAVGQAWDAWGHARLGNGGPIAWTLIGLGLVGIPVVLAVDPRRRQRTDRDRQRPRQAA